ncbi:MAG: DUF6446 family protein [Paracoccaceae bacterium]|nr:DUF6446 family protein [Paracoccaceae bacterium]
MSLNGKILVVVLVVSSALAGMALIYTQNYAYYRSVRVDEPNRGHGTESDSEVAETLSPSLTVIRLTRLDNGLPEPVPVTGFSGIDASTSPLKFRGCFEVDQSIEALKRRYVLVEGATPLRPPSWFDCFDAKRLTESLADGGALAFLGERDIAPGVDRLVAVYPDGRAFSWHQFSGEGRQ